MEGLILLGILIYKFVYSKKPTTTTSTLPINRLGLGNVGNVNLKNYSYGNLKRLIVSSRRGPKRSIISFFTAPIAPTVVATEIF